jgi:hypothetical protein
VRSSSGCSISACSSSIAWIAAAFRELLHSASHETHILTVDVFALHLNYVYNCNNTSSAAKASKQESMGDSEEFTEAVARADYIYASSTARAIFAVSCMTAICSYQCMLSVC